jgi:hypothetical protein
MTETHARARFEHLGIRIWRLFRISDFGFGASTEGGPMRNRSPAIHAQHYLTLVARAYAGMAGEPAPPAVRCNFVTLHKHAVGVKVQAWFLRRTPSRVPELRVGVAFDLTDPDENARRSAAFAERFAAELRELGAEDWPGETGLDRRLMTAVPTPGGADLDQVTTEAAALARRYVHLMTGVATRAAPSA